MFLTSPLITIMKEKSRLLLLLLLCRRGYHEFQNERILYVVDCSTYRVDHLVDYLESNNLMVFIVEDYKWREFGAYYCKDWTSHYIL